MHKKPMHYKPYVKKRKLKYNSNSPQETLTEQWGGRKKIPEPFQ